MTVIWAALLVAAVGSYLTKLAGLSLPESVLNYPRVQRVVALELFDGGQGRFTLDWRTLAGVAAAVVALLLRRGFLVVFLTAIVVTAGLRLL
jgi:hypothetical protein